MTPPNGYYTARVQYDTGGTLPAYVHVHNGVIKANDGNELRPEACSDFTPVITQAFCAVWPDRAAKELDALRERVKQLEALVNNPHALWTNWLRGTVKLPDGIGDIRKAQEQVKRLETAGQELCKASKVFLIQEVELTDDDETMTPIDKVAPSMVFAWEDPPNAGEHVRLMRAIEQWDDASRPYP